MLSVPKLSSLQDHGRKLEERAAVLNKFQIFDSVMVMWFNCSVVDCKTATLSFSTALHKHNLLLRKKFTCPETQLMSFLDELKGFDTSTLNDRETVVKQHVPNVTLADITPEEEVYQDEGTVYYEESPLVALVAWLVGLGVKGDVIEYTNLLLGGC